MNHNYVICFPLNHWAQLCVLGVNMAIPASQSDLSLFFSILFSKMPDAQAGFVVTRLSILVKGHLNRMLLTQGGGSVVSKSIDLHMKFKMFR